MHDGEKTIAFHFTDMTGKLKPGYFTFQNLDRQNVLIERLH